MRSCPSPQNLIQSSSTTQHPGAIYTSRPISAIISAVNSSKKIKIEEFEEFYLENHSDDGKY